MQPDEVYNLGAQSRGGDDMAKACVHVMPLDKEFYQSFVLPMQPHVNIGTGLDCRIRELAESIKDVTGFLGRLTFDTSKPDGKYPSKINLTF